MRRNYNYRVMAAVKGTSMNQANQMSWLRVLAVWIVIVLAESINGTIRQLFITPRIGDLPARQFGVLTASAIIFAIACVFVGWMKARTFQQQFRAGLLWVLLMVIFEFSLGTALGYPKERMLADYNLARGGFMSIGLLFMLFAPAIAAKVRCLT